MIQLCVKSWHSGCWIGQKTTDTNAYACTYRKNGVAFEIINNKKLGEEYVVDNDTNTETVESKKLEAVER